MSSSPPIAVINGNGNSNMMENYVADDIFKSAIDSSTDTGVLSEKEVELPVPETHLKDGDISNDISDYLDEQLTMADEIQSTPSIGKNKLDKLDENMSEAVDQFLDIKVTEASKIGEGMGSYVTYRIETKTNIGIFRRKSLTVYRRFSDFLGLHDKFVEKYLKTGRIIPPAPEKNVFGTTRVKIAGSQTEQNTSSTEFVERRRAALERYLCRTASHPILKIDPDFREFVESEGELPKATNTSTLSGAGMKRFFNKFGETVNKITFKMEESEPWFDQKTSLLENIDMQLRKMHNNVEVLVINRKELAFHTSQFAKSAAMLSNCEEHTGLSRALSQLADVEEKIENLHTEQAISDFTILCELLKDYIALIGAVKDAFHERVKVYQHWQHAQMMLTKKREQKVRFETAKRTDKFDSVNSEVTEWEVKVERCEDDFQKISEVIKLEFELFEKNRINDFKTIVTKYLEALVQHQVQIMKHWENFLPEAKAIN